MGAADWIPTILGVSRGVDHNLLSEPRLPGVCSGKSQWNGDDNPGVPVGMYSEKEGL